MLKSLNLITCESEWYMVPDESEEAPKRKLNKFKDKERDFKPKEFKSRSTREKHRKGSKRK